MRPRKTIFINDQATLHLVVEWLNLQFNEDKNNESFFFFEKMLKYFPEFESFFHKKAEQGRKMERGKYPDQEKCHKIIRFNKANHLRIVK